MSRTTHSGIRFCMILPKLNITYVKNNNTDNSKERRSYKSLHHINFYNYAIGTLGFINKSDIEFLNFF